MSKVIVLKEGNDPEQVMKDKVVVCYFTATWCGPCQRIKPFFHDLSNNDEYAHMLFLQVDVDDFEDFSAEHQVRAMPTFKVYKEGKVVDEMTGALETDLRNMVQKHST